MIYEMLRKVTELYKKRPGFSQVFLVIDLNKKSFYVRS